MNRYVDTRPSGLVPLISVGAIFGALVLSSCAKLSVEEARVYEIGLEAQRGERWSEAADHLSAVLESHPSHAEALVYRGVCRFHLGHEEAAVEDLETALRTHRLEESDVHRGLYYLARARLESLRKRALAGAEAPESEVENSAHAALEELDAALEIDKTYEILLWKAYCHMLLQGFDAALATVSECKVLSPDRLEHHLIEAMTLERSQSRRGNVPDRSIRIYLDLLERDRECSLHLLYEHLSETYGNLSRKSKNQVFPHLEDYLRVHPDRNPKLLEVVNTARKERENRRVQAKLRGLRETVDRLELKDRYEEALRTIEASRPELPELEEVDTLQRRLEEKWSAHLAEQADSVRLHGNRAEMRRGLVHLQKAVELTKSPRRRAILQQKIDTFRVVLSRIPESGGLARAQDLLWEGKNHDALKHLEAIREDELFETHRDAYRYLVGLAHYRLRNWKDAIDQFEQVTESKFLNFDVFCGVCLYRSGRQSEGLKKLKQVEIGARPQEALRILGAHYYSEGDYETALENLERLRQPRRDDHETLQGTLTALGERSVAARNWHRAIDLLRRARQVVESHLNQHGTVIYTLLAKAYWHVGDFARAEKVLADLFSVEISRDEEKHINEAFLYRGLLAHRRGDAAPALDSFRKFVVNGGKIPPNFLGNYHEALSLKGDFLPVSRVSAWTYRDTERGGELVFRVAGKIEEGSYDVERIASDGETAVEVWTVEGALWHREWDSASGKVSETLPIRRTTLEGTEPPVESRTGSAVVESKIVSVGEAVDLEGSRIYADCVLVETHIRNLGQPPRRTRHYLAPGVGEVKREFFEGETKTGEWALKSVEYR